MISMMMFLLVIGLVVFGPKKTIDMAQTCGRTVAQLKKIGGSMLADAAKSDQHL
jgi:Sec-independent protein translocase protein TatA